MPITSFEGKIAFITGGASGIGLGIAKVLVERGAQVVLADLRQDHIDDALAEFAGGGRSNAVSALQLDVTSREKYREAAQKMLDDFGGIDILVNNAGVGPGRPHPRGDLCRLRLRLRGQRRRGDQRLRRVPAADDRARARRAYRLDRQPCRRSRHAEPHGDLRRQQGRRVPLLREREGGAGDQGYRRLDPAARPGQEPHPRDPAEPPRAPARRQRLRRQRGQAAAPDRRR